MAGDDVVYCVLVVWVLTDVRLATQILAINGNL